MRESKVRPSHVTRAPHEHVPSRAARRRRPRPDPGPAREGVAPGTYAQAPLDGMSCRADVECGPACVSQARGPELTADERDGTLPPPELLPIVRDLERIRPDRLAAIARDVAELRVLLLAEGDARRVVAPFADWDRLDRALERSREPFVARGWMAPSAERSTQHLDRFLEACRDATLWKARLATGGAAYHTSVYHEVLRQVTGAPRGELFAVLRRSRGGRGQGASDVRAVEGFGKEIAGIAGYVTGGIGGAARSLPGLSAVGELLEEQSVEYLTALGHREGEARDRVRTSSLIGEATGTLAQLVSGPGALGKSGATLGRVASVIDTAEKTYALAVATNKKVRILGAALGFVWKTLADVEAQGRRGEDVDVCQVVLDRACKEALGHIGQAVLPTRNREEDYTDYLARLITRAMVVHTVAAVLKVVRERAATRWGGRDAAEGLGPALARKAPGVLLGSLRDVLLQVLCEKLGLDRPLAKYAADTLSKFLMETVEDLFGQLVGA